MARGEYWTVFDADDVMPAQRLEHQVDNEVALKHLQEKYQKFLKGVVTDKQAGDEAAAKPSEDVLEDA